MAGSGTAHLRPSADDILMRAENLVVEFPVGSTGLKVHAVSDVSLDIKAGETLGLVGESGCGKSTTGRALIQMPRPTSGEVLFEGTDLTGLASKDLRDVRPRMQMIFQDPISSLNPRRRVYDIVAEPLRVWKRGTKEEQRKIVNETLEAVASASASRSPGRWCSTRRSSSVTSRSRRSTCPSRPRS
jgi:peptide/nickel transport system ATP-binding protein